MRITVSKADLLEKLQENRARHRRVFEAALEGYRSTCLAAFEEQIKRIKEGRPFRVYLGLDAPADHTKDYDAVIGMLQMHTGDSFTLEAAEYRQYVQDDWGWMASTNRTFSSYAAESVSQEYGEQDDE